MCPDELGPNEEDATTKDESRATPRRHGADVQLRRLDGHARGGGFEHVLQGPGVSGDVGGGAAHVEANHLGGGECGEGGGRCEEWQACEVRGEA